MKQHSHSILWVILCMTLAHQCLNGQINDGGSLPKSLELTDFPKDNILSINLPEVKMERIKREDEINDRLNYRAPRFGVLLPVDISFDKGSWVDLENGDRIWRVKIRVPNAKATNLYFDDFYLPEGATLHVYSPDYSEILGGFGAHNNSAHGMFATALIHDNESILEYYEPQLVSDEGRIHINQVNHAYRMVDRPIRTNQRDFGESNDCEVNVNCSPEGGGKTEQRDAVARILVKAGEDTGWCSGTVINNVKEDCTPYFLTALHCAESSSGGIVPQSDFNQWIFYFNYQASGCTNPSSESEVADNTITGADIRADSQDPFIGTTSDLLLLEFQSAVPANYNVFYAGWNRGTTATTGGYGIHHPAGDIKKISTFTGTTASVGWDDDGDTHWSLYWTQTTNGHGVTEGGSSGSGLFDNNGLLIGSLSGGLSECGGPDGDDVYGKFSYHWDQNGNTANRRLKDWLDPDDTGVTSLSGTYFPCQAGDSEPYQIVSTGVKYSTLMDAISNASMGETILLTGNAQESAPITLPIGINFDFQAPYLFTVTTPP